MKEWAIQLRARDIILIIQKISPYPKCASSSLSLSLVPQFTLNITEICVRCTHKTFVSRVCYLDLNKFLYCAYTWLHRRRATKVFSDCLCWVRVYISMCTLIASDDKLYWQPSWRPTGPLLTTFLLIPPPYLYLSFSFSLIPHTLRIHTEKGHIPSTHTDSEVCTTHTFWQMLDFDE